MPLGSSSAAPVTMPGPSALRKTVSRESQDDLDFAKAVRRSPLLAPFFGIPASYPSLRKTQALQQSAQELSSNLERLTVRQRHERKLPVKITLSTLLY